MSKQLTRSELRSVAEHAYVSACDTSPAGYDRGYAMGVEDLARLLSERDPAISERLASIMTDAGFRSVLPSAYR